jgi:hypothetical protein
MTWHVDHATLTNYAVGALSRSGAASVEAHVTACATCRAAVAPVVDRHRLDSNLAAIEALVDQPRASWIERLLARCGVGERLARLVAVAPATRDPWVVSIALVLLSALAMATVGGGTRDAFVFAVVAPLLPVAAVAAVFAASTDPARELAAATPMAGLELLITRLAAVLVPAAVMSLALSLASPGLAWGVIWLLPSVGLTTATVALAGWFPVRAVASVLTAGWLAGAIASARVAADPDLVDRFAAFRPAGQVGSAVAAVVAVAVTVIRREQYDLGALR